MEGLGRHRPVLLGHKDVRGRSLFALQTPQRAYLVALHRVDTRRAVLRPADVEPARTQLHLRPLQIAQLGVALSQMGRRQISDNSASSCRVGVPSELAGDAISD